MRTFCKCGCRRKVRIGSTYIQGHHCVHKSPEHLAKVVKNLRTKHEREARERERRESLSLVDRQKEFLCQVKRTKTCWLWKGKLSKEGYGWFRGRSASREAYKLFTGSIPPRICVCHRCDNRNCVNPAHLWLGTLGENIRDMWEKGRGNPPPTTGRFKLGESRPSAMKGRKHSPVSKMLMSQAHQGKIVGVVHRANISKSLLAHYACTTPSQRLAVLKKGWKTRRANATCASN